MSSKETNTHNISNQKWEETYQQILDGRKDRFPQNFWQNNARKKAKHLIRYYVNQKAIGVSQLKKLNKRKLIRLARLQTPLKNTYNDNSTRMISDAFPHLNKKNLRWTINREIDWDRVIELRKKCCSLNQIAQDIGCSGNTIANRARIENINISIPDNKPAIHSPVEEVEYFWEQAEEAKQREITLEEMLNNLKQQNGWSESKIRNLILEHDISKKIGRKGAKFRYKATLMDYDGYLHPTEKLVARKLGKENIEILRNYGADFLYNKKTIIEVKRSINGYSIESALLQLLYARDLLREEYKLAIYSQNYELSSNKLALSKRMLNYYRVKLYEYDSKEEKFNQLDYNTF